MSPLGGALTGRQAIGRADGGQMRNQSYAIELPAIAAIAASMWMQ
jgi:hypothetical protein